MNPLLESCFSLLIPTVILVHLFCAPYTKVEESFNIQAIHDIIAHGIPTENVNEELAAHYDHVSFPGSVPRTFVGALVLAGLSRPWVQWLTSPVQLQLLVRAILGLYNAFALLSFRSAISKVFGKPAGNWLVLFSASQFHIMYYASRTLPNMFAFGMSTFALRYYLSSTTGLDASVSTKHLRLSFYLLTISGVIFRSELALLLATHALYQLVKRSSHGVLSYFQLIIPAGFAGTLIGLLVTVSVDTFFWRTWPAPLWPEWSAFAYNTIEGHASEWGISPWHYYFLNALPRLLLNPLTYTVLIPLAALNPATRGPSMDLLIPSLAFVAIYSALPHKEWRFIIYVIPALTAIASAGAAWIWTRRAKALLYQLASLVLVGSVLLSFAASAALLAISSTNYPGGAALIRLHEIAGRDAGAVRVYMGNLACQTGVTHFLEEAGPLAGEQAPQGKWVLRDDGGIEWTEFADAPAAEGGRSGRWMYDKTEDVDKLLDPAFWQQFDYVLAESPETVIGKWEVVDVVYGFGGVKIIRPAEVIGAVEGGVEEGLGSRSESLKNMVLGEDGEKKGLAKLAQMWAGVEKVAREKVTKGWWVGVRMEPKIRILKRQPLA